MMQLPTGSRTATLFEQAVVSATGFLSMLFFARHLTTVDWATFSFAASLLLLAQGLQLSIVILPMISFSKGSAPCTESQANWAWMNRSVLATMIATSAVAALAVKLSSDSWMGNSLLFAALLMPPAFTYEYLRRRLILARRFDVLQRAGLAYAVGVGFGVLLHSVVELPPVFAALTFWPGMALAFAVSGGREPLRWAAPTGDWLLPLRSFAPSAVGSSLAFAGYNLAIQAMLGILSGPAAVALFNATRMLIQPINTLIGAFNNLDLPGGAKAYAESGRALLAHQKRSVLRLVGLGGVYLALLCTFAGPVLSALFSGRYDNPAMVWGWAVVGLLMLVVTPTENIFYVTRRTGRLFANRLAAAVSGCAAALILIGPWAAVGAVLSIATGWVVALGGGVLAVWRLHKQAER